MKHTQTVDDATYVFLFLAAKIWSHGRKSGRLVTATTMRRKEFFSG